MTGRNAAFASVKQSMQVEGEIVWSAGDSSDTAGKEEKNDRKK